MRALSLMLMVMVLGALVVISINLLWFSRATTTTPPPAQSPSSSFHVEGPVCWSQPLLDSAQYARAERAWLADSARAFVSAKPLFVTKATAKTARLSRALLEAPPFPTRYKRCAVVGNGGNGV
jgi:hypothetical protein